MLGLSPPLTVTTLRISRFSTVIENIATGQCWHSLQLDKSKCVCATDWVVSMRLTEQETQEKHREKSKNESERSLIKISFYCMEHIRHTNFNLFFLAILPRHTRHTHICRIGYLLNSLLDKHVYLYTILERHRSLIIYKIGLTTHKSVSRIYGRILFSKWLPST